MNKQMRRWFLSSILTGSLGIVALGNGADAAITGSVQTLQPSTGWAISRIAANEAGSAPYCAMARKFSDDMILTFARNAKDEVSVAVDFQRDALSTGQNYFTILKPGYSQDRSFNVRPVSSKALVIRMGSDQDFFDALTRSSRLNIDLDGSQYSFVMPDMEGGLHDMRDCLSSVSHSTASAAPAGASSMPAPVADNFAPVGGPTASAQAAASIQPASGDLTPPPVNSDPLPALAPLPDRVASVDPIPVMARPPADPAPSKAELAEMRRQNADLKGQLDDARRTFNDKIAGQSADAAKTAQLTDKITALESQNDGLRTQLSQSVAQVRTSTSQMAQLQSQSALQASLQAGGSTQLSQLNDKVAQLQRHNDDLEARLAQSTADAQTVRTQMAQLNSQAVTQVSSQSSASSKAAQLSDTITQLESQNSALRTQLAQTAAQAETARTQLAQAQSQASLATSLQASGTSKASELSDKVTQLQLHNDDLEAKLAKSTADADAAKTQLALLRSQPDNSGKIATLSETINQLQHQNDNLQAQLAQTATQAKAAQAQLAQAPAPQSAPLTDKVLQLQHQNDDLHAQLELTTTQMQSAKTELNQLRVQAALTPGNGAGQNPQLSEKLAKLEAQNDQLRAQLSQTAAQTQAAKAKVAKAEADAAAKVASSIPSCPAPDKQAAIDPATEAELATLRDENQHLKRQSSMSGSSSQQEMARMQDENTHLKQEVDSLHTQVASIATLPPAAQGDDQATVARLTSRIDELQSENTHLTESINKVQIDPSGVPDGTVTLAQLRATQAQLDAAKADRDQMQRKIEDMRTGQVDKLLAASGDNWDLKQATQRYGESQREVDRLGLQIETERQSCTKDKKEAEYMLFDPRIATKKQIAKLDSVEKSLRAAQNELAKRNNETADLRKSYDSKIAALQRDVNQKQSQLADAQSDIKETQSDFKNKLVAKQGDAAQIAQYKKALFDKEAALAQATAAAKTAQADYEQQLAAAKQDIAVRDTQLADAGVKLNGIQADYNQKLAAVNTGMTQLGQAQGATADLNQQLTMRTLQLDDARSKLDALQKEYAQKNETSTVNSTRLAEIQKATDDLNQQLAARNKELADARGQLDQTQKDYDQKLASAQTAASQANQQLASAQTDVSQANQKLAALSASSTVAAIAPAAGERAPASIAPPAMAVASDTDHAAAVPVAAVAEPTVLAAATPSAPLNIAPDDTMADADADIIKTPMIAASAGSQSRIVKQELPAMDIPAPAKQSPPSETAQAAQARQMAQIAPAAGQAQQMAQAAPATSQAKFIDAASMQSMLTGAGVHLSKNVEPVAKTAGPAHKALSWQIGALYGSADQQPMPSPQQFDSYVQTYLNKAKGRCHGQFAAIPGQLQDSGSSKEVNYEIACVDEKNEGASASLLFYSRDGVFTTIAHEANVDSMEQAMDTRDRLASSLMSSKVASR